MDRITALAIPPAWRDVWICPDPRGHIQAVGTDAAGRRQYRYHDAWRERRDREKFEHVLAFARRLPRLRRAVADDLAGGGLGRARVLAAAVRLLDLGAFRVGGEEYANGDDATYGLATLRRDHVTVTRDGVEFRYPGKGGIQHGELVADPDVRPVVRALRHRRHPSPELLAYRNGRDWHDVHSADINEYLRAASGGDVTAKDFRTWHATVLAAAALATEPTPRSPRTGARVITRVCREVSEHLGNTPAVVRKSYVDPRVFDLYLDGVTIAAPARLSGGRALRRVELAVLRLLSG